MDDDDVSKGADRVVEVAAVLDAEALGHRDLHALEVGAAPERLQHRVGEAQVENLVRAHLPQEVVDAVELRLVDVLVELRRELPRRRAVVAERLLDDDARVLRQPRLRQALHDGAEEEGRDLEVEDRALRAVDRLGQALVRGRVGEVAGDIGEPVGEALEDLRVELLARAFDRLAGAVLQLVDGPVVHGHADDRTVDQAPPLEAVERHERHHLREVARDSEGHEDVRRARLLDSAGRGRGGGHRRHCRLLS